MTETPEIIISGILTHQGATVIMITLIAAVIALAALVTHWGRT